MQIAQATCKADRMNVMRLFGRALIVAGGLFWVTALFGARYYFQGVELTAAVGSALVPLAATVAAIAVGWFYERTAAGLLTAGALGLVVWGVVAGWEVGVWGIMAIFVIGPMLAAAALLVLAWRMERICAAEA